VRELTITVLIVSPVRIRTSRFGEMDAWPGSSDSRPKYSSDEGRDHEGHREGEVVAHQDIPPSLTRDWLPRRGSTATAVLGVPVLVRGSGRRGLGPGVVAAARTSRRRRPDPPWGGNEGVEQAPEFGHGQRDELSVPAPTPLSAVARVADR
jgi:hypothetical protein